MKTYNVVYKPTGELVLEAAARIRREREKALRSPRPVRCPGFRPPRGGLTSALMEKVGFETLARVLRRRVA